MDSTTEPRGLGAREPLSSPFLLRLGTLGDHHTVKTFVCGQLGGPRPGDFQSQLDDPFYEPIDRVLGLRNGALIGHARIQSREMHFGLATLPVANLVEMAVAPEYRRHGHGTAILETAERRMVQEGAVLGIVRTRETRFFLNRGWLPWTKHSYSTAQVREILAWLQSEQSPPVSYFAAPAEEVAIRCWRHIETGGLRRLYSIGAGHSYGMLERTEAYWQWLLARRGFDHIYVAIGGHDRFDLEEGAEAMVGYAVVRGDRILELVVSPHHPAAGRQLLARACSDTMERDGNYLRLDAPVGDPLHQVLARARGDLGYYDAVHGEATLVKPLDLPRLTQCLGPELAARATQAGCQLPASLGISLPGERWSLAVTADGAELRSGPAGRSQLHCGRHDFTQLLLGQLDLRVVQEAGRARVNTRVAGELASILFPKVPLWRPPWDDASGQ